MESTLTQAPVQAAARRSAGRWRCLKDRAARRILWSIALVPPLLLILMAAGLAARTSPLFAHASPLALLIGETWSPQRGLFGFLPFIVGTVWVTTVAMVIALPPTLLMAIYLAEYARPSTRSAMKPILDILAARQQRSDFVGSV